MPADGVDAFTGSEGVAGVAVGDDFGHDVFAEDHFASFVFEEAAAIAAPHPLEKFAVGVVGGFEAEDHSLDGLGKGVNVVEVDLFGERDVDVVIERVVGIGAGNAVVE